MATYWQISHTFVTFFHAWGRSQGWNWFCCLGNSRCCIGRVRFVLQKKPPSIDAAITDKKHHNGWPGRSKREWRDLWVLRAHGPYHVVFTAVITFKRENNINKYSISMNKKWEIITIVLKNKANWLSLTVVNGVLVIVTPTGKVIFNVRKHDVKVNISNEACN